MKKAVITALALSALVLFTGCGTEPKPAENKNAKPAAATEQAKPAATDKKEAGTPAQNDGSVKKQKALGALSAEQALDYMKNTKDLIIVDVAPRKAYDKGHFIGALSIPIEGMSKEEEDKRYKEIPAGKPVLVCCRRGIYAPGAYKRIVELRPDIPEIAYIEAAPPIQSYNEWKATQGK